jgi:hypothetical protein
MINQAQIKFNVYRSDGSKSPTLRRSFLIKLYINKADRMRGYLKLPDNTKWTLITEEAVLKAMGHDQTVRCIVSFQVHEHADDTQVSNFAVARFYNPNKESSFIEPKSAPKVTYKRKHRYDV